MSVPRRAVKVTHQHINTTLQTMEQYSLNLQNSIKYKLTVTINSKIQHNVKVILLQR